MISLSKYIQEGWADEVKPKWKPEEGLFTNPSASYIANYLLKHSKDQAQAMSRLIFYMNRAGDDCPNKAVLNQAKNILAAKKED